MKLIGIGVLLAASLCFAQDSSDFKPPTSNVLDAQYPKVDGNSRQNNNGSLIEHNLLHASESPWTGT